LQKAILAKQEKKKVMPPKPKPKRKY